MTATDTPRVDVPDDELAAVQLCQTAHARLQALAAALQATGHTHLVGPANSLVAHFALSAEEIELPHRRLVETAAALLDVDTPPPSDRDLALDAAIADTRRPHPAGRSTVEVLVAAGWRPPGWGADR